MELFPGETAQCRHRDEPAEAAVLAVVIVEVARILVGGLTLSF
jgi:hypothetical protein